jgi:photosynthetic reaction center cytochrome c subunit
MRRRTRQGVFGAVGAAVLCLLLVPPTRAQKVDPSAKPVMAEQYFKNIQSLRGIPVDEFMDTMGMFAAATNMSCADCHIPESGGSWARYADDNDLKRKTRMMIVMVDALNKTNFGGAREVTCYTCHRGNNFPDVVPSLELQYSTPLPADPVEITQTLPGSPSVDAVLDKFISAIGGAQKLASVTSLVGKGQYRLYDDFEWSPLELYAKSPNQRTTIQHSPYGDITTTFDGKSAWQAAPEDVRPYPVVALSGGNLEGAGVDAAMSFPGRVKQILSGWRVGPASILDDKDIRIIQGKTASGFLVKLYFDEQSGLLLRTMRYSNSPVGRVPVRVDYSDYRDVNGIKIPFKWISTWTDGRTVFQLDSVQLNTAVDAAKFNKPTPPAAPNLAKN